MVKWPFRSPVELPPTEAQQWWERCYVPGIVDTRGVWPRWSAFLGKTGSGKTIALVRLQQLNHATFFIPYEATRWIAPWLPGEGHLAQIMVSAGIILRNHFLTHPTDLHKLSALQLEFLRWLLEKYQGYRAYVRFIHALPEHRETLHQVPFEDLYPTTYEPLDIQGQIDELVSLVRSIGYEDVRVVMDFNADELQQVHDRLVEFWQLCFTVQHPHFGGYFAFPEELVSLEYLSEETRGRVQGFLLQWPENALIEMFNRTLSVALRSWSPLSIHDPVGKTLMEFLRNLYKSTPPPRAWIDLAETITALVALDKLTLPLDVKDMSIIGEYFYMRHVPLHLDKDGVWLGPKYIPLSPQLLALLEVLVSRKGRPVSTEDPYLHHRLNLTNLERATAARNIHTLASRLRKAIEPIPNRPIYIKSRRGEGYWVENVRF